MPILNEKPNIYEFTALSSYLKCYCEYKKTLNPRWSLGLWSKKLGLTGSGTLSNFISGRRIPASETLELLKKDIALSEYEIEYFDALVIISSKTTDVILQKAAKALLNERSIGKEYLEMSDEDFKKISSPLAMVLKESFKLQGFELDPTWIKERLLLHEENTDKIAEVLETLKKAGLISGGESHYKTPKDINSESLKTYYESALEINKRSIREIEREERHLNSISFCCDSKRIPELKEAIHEFSKKILHEFDQDQGDVVYQIHTQLVPHMDTRKILPS